MLTFPRSTAARLACVFVVLLLAGFLVSSFVDIDLEGDWDITPFRITIDYHAVISYEAVDHKSLTYVSRKLARELQTELTAQDESLAHFWEQTAAWVGNQNQRSFPMDTIGNEYAKFVEHYFDGTSPTLRFAIEAREKTGSMVFGWLVFTE